MTVANTAHKARPNLIMERSEVRSPSMHLARHL